MVSLWCELLCKISIYTFKSDQRIKIWWAKFELECLLLIFTYSNSKFKVTCKNTDFECWYNRTHTKEKLSKIPNITFAILPFAHKNTYLNCHPEYFRVCSWGNHQMCFKMVHSNTRNAHSRVCQSQVCFLCTTHSSALKNVGRGGKHNTIQIVFTLYINHSRCTHCHLPLSFTAYIILPLNKSMILAPNVVISYMKILTIWTHKKNPTFYAFINMLRPWHLGLKIKFTLSSAFLQT